MTGWKSACELLVVSFLCGCASGYPTRPPASPGIHLAVLQYQIDEQVHGAFRAVFVAIEEQPKTFPPGSSVIRALRAGGAPIYASASAKQLPAVPQETMLWLGVDARPERVYPDQIVILGEVSLGLSVENGSYRYFLEPSGASWKVVRAEPVVFDTDCYGYRWIKP